MRILRVVPGFHLFLSPASWWIGIEVLPEWIAVQPLPCAGFAIRWRRA